MKTESGVLQDYGKQKLLGYADSLRELADSFQRNENTEQEYIEGFRQQRIMDGRNREQRSIFASQMQEVAQLLAGVARENCQIERISEKKYRQIVRELKQEGLLVSDLFYVITEGGNRECSLRMRAIRNEGITVDDTAGFLSVILNNRLVAHRGSPFFVGNEWNTYVFQEEPGYHILTGAAKATKQTELVSGDNHVFFEYGEGKAAMLLSDGVGSGEDALEESTLVTSLMQRFLEAGFSVKSSLQMVNGVLLMGNGEEKTSTVDMCSIDLYQGVCSFCKVGAAPSYIKRNNMVEQISSRNLPLGLVDKPDPEMPDRVLEDGDYVILLSDGIIDAMNQGMGESALPEIISKFQTQNPGELANDILSFVLHQCGGKVRDDMTVLVTGIWKCSA